MAQTQSIEQQNASDSQVQSTPKDSQLSSVAQLSGSDGSTASRTSWANASEPANGQLNMQAMFSPNNLAAELGIGALSDTNGSSGGAANGFANLGQEFSQLGASFTAIGKDLTNISTDMSNLNSDITGLLNSLGNASGGNYAPPTDGGASGATTTPENSNNTGATSTPDNTNNTGATSTPDNTNNTGATSTPDNTNNTGATSTPDNTNNTGATSTPDNTNNTGATSTPDNTNNTGATSTPDNTGGSTPRTPGTPFASDSIFNTPLGSGAQWEQNSQLDNAGVFINTNGNYNEPIYTGTANDPLVTVTSDGAAGGGAGTFQVHIPQGAIPAAGGDQTFTVNDTAQNTWFSFGGFNWTGPDSATVSQGSAEPFDGSGMTQDNSNWDEGVGTLTGADLQAGTIDHMLRMELPTTMLESYTNDTNQLAPFAYPQTQEDGFAVNGNGGPAYSGTVPYGVTIGIPQGVAEPADVAANPGANMLWQALQDHGAMVRDSGGTGNNVIFQTDQNVDSGDPLVQGMQQYGNEIMAATQILTNQGPDSINGGGTPVVPLDAPPSGG